MAEVVARSTQFLSEADLEAMAAYLASLPDGRDGSTGASRDGEATSASTEKGAKLYSTHCAACHGDRGEGVAGAYPALAGNRAVAITPPANLVHMVLRGGFLPTTPGNPRPFGMPPFATVLSDEQIGEVLSYVRASWGNRAPQVSTLEVSRYRGAR